MEKPGEDTSMKSGLSDSDKLKQGDILIRTMQDDIASVKETKSSSSKTVSDSNISKKVIAPVVDNVSSRKIDKNTPSVPDSRSTTPQALPVSPRPQTSMSQKVVMAPPRKVKGQSHFFLKVLVAILVLSIIGGAGVIGWTFFLADYIKEGDVSNQPIVSTDINNVVPRDIVMMVSYKINNEQDATSIVNAWQKISNDAPSMTGLLKGDPRYIINEFSVDQIHYFLLEGESSPYLLIPKTENSSTVVTSMSSGEVVEVDGWYVLHAFDTGLYEQGLSQGVWANKDSVSAEFSFLDNKVSVVMGEEMLLSARKAWGNSFSMGQIKELFMNGSFLSQEDAISLTGIAAFVGEANISNIATDQLLLQLVPSDISIVRMGSNFVEDLYAWNKESNLLDVTILEKPIVENLLRDLSTTYAYYSRQGEDGAVDIGLVIQVPDSLRDQLTIGDNPLEETLPLLIPLIADRGTQSEFAFQDNTYSNVPLRYVNIAGPNQALDYTIMDGNILIASSKEGMFRLIDTVNRSSSSLNTADNWQRLLGAWGTLPQSRDLVIGRINNSVLTSLLPVASDDGELIFGLSANITDSASMSVNGILLLDNNSVTSQLNNSELEAGASDTTNGDSLTGNSLDNGLGNPDNSGI